MNRPRREDGDLASLASAPAQLNYRPLRRTYSIRRDDADSCSDVIRYASRCWGGIHDLIAIEADDGTWDGYTDYAVHAADPDTVIVAGGEGAEQVMRMERLTRTHPSLEVITVARHHWGTHALRPTVVGASQFTPVAVPPNAALWEAAAWGDESATSLIEDSDSELIATTTETPEAPPWEMPIARILTAVMTGDTVLDATASSIRIHAGSSMLRYKWVFVPLTTPSDLIGVVLFWNTRALCEPFRTRVVPWPLWASTEQLAPLRPLIEHGLGDKRETEPDVFVCCYSGEVRDAARRAMPGLFPLVDHAEKSLHGHYPAKPRTSPPSVAYALLNLPEFQRLTVGISSEYPMRLGDELRLRLAPPESVSRAIGATALDLVDFAPLVMPRRPGLAHLVHPNARASAAGFSWTGFFRPSEWRIQVPSDRQVLTTLAARHEVAGATSAWGDMAQRTLNLVGGLPGVGVIQDDIALRTLAVLARAERGSGSGRPVRDERTAFAMSDIKGWIWPEEKNKGKKDVAPALDRLVIAGLVFAGLRVTCAECGMSEWRIVDDVRSEMICRGCRTVLPLRLTSERYDTIEPTWEYRLNQLLARPVNQGVLPALLALKVLSGRARYRFRFALGHEVAGLGELDALMTIDREPAVLEVKVGDHLDDDEIARSVEAARRLRGYAVFATEAAAWSENTLARLLAAQQENDDGQRTIEALAREHLLGRTRLPLRLPHAGLVERHA
jgi:hypothetical protein